MYMIPFGLANTDQDFAKPTQGRFVTNYLDIGNSCA